MLDEGTCEDPRVPQPPRLLHPQQGRTAAAILARLQDLGERRVMYAMDYPYEYTPGEVTAQDELPLDAAAKKAFFQGIAEQVFGLLR